jgi:two-component system sensor histidine kinase HydH
VQDLPIKRGTLKFIMSIKPRMFLLIGLCLAVLFLTIVVIGIRENRANVIRMMKNEARALMESVISASSNTLSATDMVDRLVLDNLSDIATIVGRSFESGDLTAAEIARVCQSTGINRMDVIDSNGIVAVSSVVDVIGQDYDTSFTSRFPFDDIIMGHIKSASFVLDDENPVIPAQIVLATARVDEPGAVVLFTDYSVLQSFGDRIGIGSLIRRIGEDQDIEYIFMQTYDGVIFSSHSFGQVRRIDADDFLMSVIERGGYDSRVIDFMGTEVLEVVRPFEAIGLPPGVLRIGLSMEGYRQVTGNFEMQLIAIGSILFVVSFLVVTMFLANLNYRALESSYTRMKSVTENILDSMHSGVVVTDAGGAVTLFNPRAQEIFSYKEQDVLGIAYSDLFAEDTLMLNELTVNIGSTIRGEREFTLGDGARIMLLVAASRVVSDDGEQMGAVSVVYDVTESRRLEKKAKRSERLSELGNLAAGVAHEIRNPLNAISIASQRLKSEFIPTTDAGEYGQLVDNIKSEISRLNEIINQFLALARSRAVDSDVVNLSDVSLEVVALMGEEANQKGLRVIGSIAPALAVRGKSADLRKVLINLIKNALQACDSGNTIWVNAEETTDGKIRVTVEDDGPGIPPENREKVFRPYFTTKDDGTGLGLALSHRIIVDHEGSLDYAERRGGGSAFVITLPSAG